MLKFDIRRIVCFNTYAITYVMNQVCQNLKASFAQNETVCSRINELFHLLSNKGRFRIICLLCFGEYCVNDIAEVVSHGCLPNVSQHLKTLALSGVIERRREGQRILYRLKDERVRNIIGFMRSQFLESGTSDSVDQDRDSASPNAGIPVRRVKPKKINKTTTSSK
jgi:DNA-binding transcriptional ArsR family regulator